MTSEILDSKFINVKNIQNSQNSLPVREILKYCRLRGSHLKLFRLKQNDLTSEEKLASVLKWKNEIIDFYSIQLRTVPCKKTIFFGRLWSKMGSIQIEIKYLKRAARILIFWLLISMNQIFQMRYYETFNDNL